jgi:hypothetical protein
MPPKENYIHVEYIEAIEKPKKNIIPVEYMKATYDKVYEMEKPDFFARCAALEWEIYGKIDEIEIWEARHLVIMVERPRFLDKVKIVTKLLILKATNMPFGRLKFMETMSESDIILKKIVGDILDRDMHKFYHEFEKTKRAIILEDPTTDESDAELEAYKQERGNLRKKVVEEVINGNGNKSTENYVKRMFDSMNIGEDVGPF